MWQVWYKKDAMWTEELIVDVFDQVMEVEARLLWGLRI